MRTRSQAEGMQDDQIRWRQSSWPLLTSKHDMKHLLITTIAAVVLVGCGEAQPPEPPTAKAPDISIHKAAIIGNTEAIQQHLAAGTDVNAKAGGGDTPLDWAIMGKRTGAADLLRKHGGMMVEELRSGMTPLHAAARKGLKEVVELLIHEGTDVNAKSDDGWTPLHKAALQGHKEIAKVLIAAGADVDAKNNRDMTPLHQAARSGRKEIAGLLLAKGADVNAKTDDGRTPLDSAIKDKHTETAALLRKHGGKTGEGLKAEGK